MKQIEKITKVYFYLLCLFILMMDCNATCISLPAILPFKPEYKRMTIIDATAAGIAVVPTPR